MKLQKLLTGSTAALLVVAMLASCGNNNNSSSSGGSSSSSTTSSSSGSSAASTDGGGSGDGGRAKEGIMYTEGLPIVDPGDYTFSLFFDDGQDDDDYVMFPILEEQTGIHVDVRRYPNAVIAERLSLELNSGDYADCLGGWIHSANDILVHGVEEQVYIPLDEYFDKYCPRITEVLNLEGVRDTMTTPDGHIYSIPYALSAPAVPFNPFVNLEWLERVNMEMPTTTEEFRELLRAFKEQDANGNGDPNDEVPFTVGPDNKHLGDLCGWFGMSVNDEGFTMVGDKLTFGANTEEYKNGIRYLASLYAEGLMDVEMFTQDSSQWKARGGNDTYGVVTCYSSGDFDTTVYEPGAKPHWDPLPVLSSPECSNPVYLRDTYGTTVLKNQVVISDNAEHPEAICRWWDTFFELDNYVQSQNGPLDICVFKEGDDYRVIDKTTLSEDDQKLYDWGNLWPQSLPKYSPPGFQVKRDAPPDYDQKKQTDELYDPYLTEAIPSAWTTSEQASRVADLSTAIKDYITQKKAEWISGQSDIDADWDAYLAQLDRLGLEELVQFRLEALGQ